MKLSTRGRYATRAMLDLALHLGEGPLLAKDISSRQQISARYLEQVFTPLRVAGLVKTIRGARGGFSLARPTSEIRLLDIIRATEGSTAPVECVDDAQACPRSTSCVARDVWVRMKQATDEVLASTTLQDLVDQHRQTGQS